MCNFKIIRLKIYFDRYLTFCPHPPFASAVVSSTNVFDVLYISGIYSEQISFDQMPSKYVVWTDLVQVQDQNNYLLLWLGDSKVLYNI